MKPLPMVPASCSLSQPELREQLARYRAVGQGTEVIERTLRRLAVRVGEVASDDLVERLVAVERGCCPFFDLSWEPEQRRLAISVSESSEEPALDAIAFALGVDERRVTAGGSG
jgi:hypothetical protein